MTISDGESVPVDGPEMEQKYLEDEPDYKLMPVMFRFRDHA
jgi:hypothetical protein